MQSCTLNNALWPGPCMSASLAVCSPGCTVCVCVCVGLCFCYHDPWLWITFTIHQLITNYCLVVIPISLMMLRWDHHHRGSISLTPRPPSILGSLSACQFWIFLENAWHAFNDFFLVFLLFIMNIMSGLWEPLLFFGLQRLYFSTPVKNIEPQVSIVVHGLLRTTYCRAQMMIDNISNFGFASGAFANNHFGVFSFLGAEEKLNLGRK